MNIPEYFMCEAERCDNGEIVRGQLINRSQEYFHKYSIATTPHSTKFRDGRQVIVFETFYEVKPETVKRVAMKPIFDGGINGESEKYSCPNCLSLLWHRLRQDKCCPDCMMAIDWS